MKIHHIAVSPDGRRVAFGAFEHSVEIWDIHTGRMVSAFESIFDFGGRRLAINKSGSVIVAAAYTREGIAGYNAENGDLLWQRRDLKKAQLLTSSPGTGHIYAGLADAPGCVLDCQTGETLSRHRGVRYFVESPHAPLIFMDGSRPAVYSIDGLQKRFPIERFSFAFLSAAFSPNHIAVSGSGRDVQCFNVSDGSAAWTFKPDDGVHCLRLTHSKADDAFFGVLRSNENVKEKRLVRFDGHGTASPICDLRDSKETEFAQSTDTLITSKRQLINITDGTIRNLV